MSTPAYTETPLDELDLTYDRLNATFHAFKTLPIEYRLYNLKQLAFMIQDNIEAIYKALHSDLSKEPFDIDVGDVWPILNEIELAVRRLPEWMADEKATRDSVPAFKLSRPHVRRQPKGVSLIIGAWNYPFQLTLSPLVGAIAAGCPAIIKCSEHSPASAALIAELIPRYLDPEGYAVVNGAIPQSTALLKKRWGHILYTGNGAVGKIVATAAAKTLTPSTLELGGKSPTIVASDANITMIARRMMSIKQLNIGQMCVSPDYVLCTKDKVEELVAAITKTLDEFYPKGSERSLIGKHGQAAAFRNSNDYDRIEGVIDEAQKDGKLVYRGEEDKANRRMGISVVRLNKDGAGEEGILVNEEIWGPVLPIIPVDDVDAAIEYVNARPTPLALYVCSGSRATFDKVISRTLSGSAIWNDFSFAPVVRTLPFGGVGESGWGSYHGENGFLAFSHRKAVLEMPGWMEIAQKSRYPNNYADSTPKRMKMVMTARLGFKRPVSVEHERRALDRARNRRSLYLGFLLVLIGASAGLGGRRIAEFLGGLKAKLGF